MSRVLLFNGPPGSGKDTLAMALHERHASMISHMKFAQPLKDICHAMLGIQHRSDLEHIKDQPLDMPVHVPGVVTLRDFYIYVSERIIKPLLGQDIFGRLAVTAMKQSPHAVQAFSDCGFASEIQPVIDAAGRDAVVLFRLHRPGHDFTHDSRSYVQLDLDTSHVHDIYNATSKSDLVHEVALRIHALWPDLALV